MPIFVVGNENGTRSSVMGSNILKVYYSTMRTGYFSSYYYTTCPQRVCRYNGEESSIINYYLSEKQYKKD